MSTTIKNINSLLTCTSDVITLFASEESTPEIQPHIDAFKASHAALAASAKRATQANAALAAAKARVTGAREALHEALEALAVALVHAGTSTRREPFKGFSAVIPSRIVVLARTKRGKEVRSLVEKVLAGSPTPAVEAAAHACVERDEALDATEQDSQIPARRLTQEVAERELRAQELLARTKSLRVFAQAAWHGDDVRVDTLFRPLKARRTRKKSEDATPEPPVSPAPVTPGAPVGAGH